MNNSIFKLVCECIIIFFLQTIPCLYIIPGKYFLLMLDLAVLGKSNFYAPYSNFMSLFFKFKLNSISTHSYLHESVSDLSLSDVERIKTMFKKKVKVKTNLVVLCWPSRFFRNH